MTAETFHDMLWNSAILTGWLAIISLSGRWHARRKFLALLKAPLTDEVEQLTHVWERRITRWTTLGLLMSGLSLLCFVGSLILTVAGQ